MFKKKFSTLLIVVMMLSLVLTGCGGTDEPADETAGTAVESDVIKIGVFEPLTGANAAGGQMELEGIELANKLYPEVLGKKVELVVADNKSDQQESVTAVNKLISDDNVNAIIGSWGSSFSMAAGDIILEKGIPTVAASATNPMVTAGNDYYFRVCFIDPFQAQVQAKYVAEQGIEKVAIIKEVSNDYAVGLAKFFTDALVAHTGNPDCVVENLDYQTGDKDFSAQLQTVAQSGADMIFAPGNFTEAALISKQAQEQGLDVAILGGDTWEAPEFLEIGGDSVVGTTITTFFATENPPNETSKEFIDQFRAEYGKEPSSVAALGYDCYLLILDAIERAGSADPQAIRDALAETVDFEGAAGNVSLDENGDAVKSVVIKEVVKNEDGTTAFKYVGTVDPE